MHRIIPIAHQIINDALVATDSYPAQGAPSAPRRIALQQTRVRLSFTAHLTPVGLMDEVVKAGILLAGEGLQPSSKGARVRYAGSKRTIVDRPFGC